MADSIPSLRRKLAEANARIQELESRPPVVVEREVRVKGDVVRVEVPGPISYVPVETPGPERPVYVDNPDHIETIRKLQEQLCQYISASASLSSQHQDEQSSLSAPLQAQE